MTSEADEMTSPMSGRDTLEGKLMAQQRLLCFLLARLPEPDWQVSNDWLAMRAVLQDGQEDPGAVPTEGMTLELAMSGEFRKIAELAARYRSEASAQ